MAYFRDPSGEKIELIAEMHGERHGVISTEVSASNFRWSSGGIAHRVMMTTAQQGVINVGVNNE